MKRDPHSPPASPATRPGQRRPGISWPGWWVALLLCSLTPAARAEVKVFQIDPSRSVIELRGGVRIIGLNYLLNYHTPQTYSRLTAWQGLLVAEVSPETVEFLGGNRVSLRNNGVWPPGFHGVEGMEPGQYGARVGNVSFPPPQIQIFGHAACRDWAFETVSTNITRQNGEFPMRPVQFRFLETALPAIDYRFELTTNINDPDSVPDKPGKLQPGKALNTTIIAGRALPSGMLTNRVATRGRVELVDGFETLTLPLEGWYSVASVAGSGHTVQFDLILEGTLVAVRVPVIEREPPVSAGQPWRLHWPAGYRLQRATHLWPSPDWEEHANEAPLELWPAGPPAFYRAIRDFVPLPSGE